MIRKHNKQRRKLPPEPPPPCGGGHGGRRMNRELTITERWTEHKENAEVQAAKTREGAKRAHSELDGITDMATQKRQRQKWQRRHMTAWHTTLQLGSAQVAHTQTNSETPEAGGKTATLLTHTHPHPKPARHPTNPNQYEVWSFIADGAADDDYDDDVVFLIASCFLCLMDNKSSVLRLCTSCIYSYRQWYLSAFRTQCYWINVLY